MALFDGSRASYTGVTRFAENRATYNFGGAILAHSDCVVSLEGENVFFNNSADSGGALCMFNNSRADFSGNTTFSHNIADDDQHSDGGALAVWDVSDVNFDGETRFSDNTAVGSGGALSVTDSSSVSFDGITYFENSRAEEKSGGAMYLDDSATVSWEGRTYFFNNSGVVGGALVLYSESNVTWSGETQFTESNTYSSNNGGALTLYGSSSASWSGNTRFTECSAGGDGGAMIVDNSTVSWNGETSFENNSCGGGGDEYDGDDNASGSGGAIFMYSGARLSWTGKTIFSGNTAVGFGGALYLTRESSLEFDEQTLFFQNRANESGGALHIIETSTVSWGGETNFSQNEAAIEGGALYVADDSNVVFEGSTFFDNEAAYGGAIFIAYNSLTWNGPTEFTNNYAISDGGAVASSVPQSGQIDSKLIINGSTRFANNVCGANGGGMVVVGALTTTFITEDVTFSGNRAGVSGGAVYISGVGLGLEFRGMTFESNTAELGGGVSVTGSGNAVTQNEQNGVSVIERHPTTFDRCDFIGNRVNSAGGAIESDSGLDDVKNSSFVGNTAGVGGALRIAGEASLTNCSFEENSSDVDGGPAVSIIGYIDISFGNCFYNHLFQCPAGQFLEYLEVSCGGSYMIELAPNKCYNMASNQPIPLIFILSQPSQPHHTRCSLVLIFLASFQQSVELETFKTLCHGCGEDCKNCCFDEPSVVPVCTPQLGHSTSAGGAATVEMLVIDHGYWRATPDSTEVLACYNTDACRGGVTGAHDYCNVGYEGPCEYSLVLYL